MSIPTRQTADASIGLSRRQQTPAACTSLRGPQTRRVPIHRSAPARPGNRAGGAADAGREDDGGGRPTDPRRSSSPATSHGKSHSRAPLPASPPPASDQNQRIVREPATTPDHDTPRADGCCSAGRAVSKPGWPPPCFKPASNRKICRRFTPSSSQASATRRRPDRTPSRTSSRSNSFLLIDTTGIAHPRGPSNLGQCHVNFAEGCHLYIAATCASPIRPLMENIREPIRSETRRSGLVLQTPHY